MKTNKKNNIPKTPTGIHGLDEITKGGLTERKANPDLRKRRLRQNPVRCSVPGEGITEFNEPGVFMSFEESAKDLSDNVGSLCFDLHWPGHLQENCSKLSGGYQRNRPGRSRLRDRHIPAENKIEIPDRGTNPFTIYRTAWLKIPGVQWD